jgi:glycyl-tRNA synthetase beta chain
MRTNQKYFPLFDREGKLSQHFLIVSNMRVADPSRIIEGNQRVVRPRLADAEFFFDTDKKTTLAARLPQLAQVVYHNQLGSQAERIKRVEAIATRLAQLPAVRAKYGDITGEVAEAARLCKADLLSLMVGEFASLQGIMGRYYAHNDGKSDAVADAIADHYKPRFAGDVLPRGGVGTVLALADKLETLIGLFGIGQVPTGDKDPFALRRHALGVLRLLRENQLAVDLRRDLIGPQIASFGALIKDPSEALVTYFAERLSGLMRDEGYSAQEVAAVQAVDEQVVLRVPERLQAVRAFSAMPEAAGLAAANKRVGNILKKADTADAVDSVDTDRRTVDVQLLHEPAEQALAQALAELSPRLKQYLAAQQYTDYLLALAALGKPVDQFFTDVMVNAEDPALKRNRLLLLTQLQSALRQVADLSALAG